MIFFQIRIGDHDFNQMDETQIEENTIKVAKITVHPKYGKRYSDVLRVKD